MIAMPRLRRPCALLTLLIAASCGQVEPVLVGARMPDCAQIGSTEMREGRARVVLGLDGLADVGLYLVRLDEGMSHDDLVEHLEESVSLPAWASIVVTLEVEDPQGIEGTEEVVSLDRGSYAVVCVDHGYEDAARLLLAGPLEVRASS